jgi:hypothetical protein
VWTCLFDLLERSLKELVNVVGHHVIEHRQSQLAGDVPELDRHGPGARRRVGVTLRLELLSQQQDRLKWAVVDVRGQTASLALHGDNGQVALGDRLRRSAGEWSHGCAVHDHEHRET